MAGSEFLKQYSTAKCKSSFTVLDPSLDPGAYRQGACSKIGYNEANTTTYMIIEVYPQLKEYDWSEDFFKPH